MPALTITLDEDLSEVVATKAAELQMSPAQLVRIAVLGMGQSMTDDRQEFLAIANYILKKNEELYRRLS